MDTYTLARIRNKSEKALVDHVRKATSSDESAPKSKHVRECILFTWDFQSSQSIWEVLKAQPLLSDEIQFFKSLILIHKVIREGPSICLTEAQRERNFLTQTLRQSQVVTESRLGFKNDVDDNSYRQLIRLYVLYLEAKLDIHLRHSDFTGSFDYNEYVSRHKVGDPFEGLNVIHELFELQDKLDHFQKQILAGYSPLSNNECRISALVPLIEESYGIYLFLQSMIDSMDNYQDLELSSLHLRFDQQHDHLVRFYYECSQIRYLTSLVDIPVLSKHSKYHMQPNQLIPGGGYNPQQQQQMMQYQQQQQQMMQYQTTQHQTTQQYFVSTSTTASAGISPQQYELRIQSLQQEKNLMNAKFLEYKNSQEQALRQAHEQADMWRMKYEQLSQAYQQLRNEHTELLSKVQLLQTQGAQVADQMRQMQQQLQMKQQQLDAVQSESRQAELQMQQARATQAQLQQMVQQLQSELQQMQQARQRDASELSVSQQQSQQLLEQQQQRVMQLEAELQRNRMQLAESERAQQSSREEIQLLKASVDQVLRELNEAKSMQSSAEQRLAQEQSQVLLRLYQEVLQQAQDKLHDAAYEIDNSAYPGNTAASPEMVLVALEKTLTLVDDFKTACRYYLTGQSSVSDAMPFTMRLADQLVQLTQHAKGLTRLTGNEKTVEQLLALLRQTATSGKDVFAGVAESSLEKLNNKSSSVMEALQNLTPLVDQLKSQGDSNNDSDLDKVLDAAAKTVADAAARLRDMRNNKQFSVHAALLDTAVAVAAAVSRLVQCATASQQEIVQHNKENSSALVFYKKNSRWVDGLVSAAKAVAMAVGQLVDTADSVVQGKSEALEPLIVASQEVAAATAQLVAAARVKALPHSATQEKLEAAAKAVSEATQLLVKAVKAHRGNVSESNDDDIAQQMAAMSLQQFKVEEMNQRVAILTLEKQLTDARRRLAAMRKVSYHTGDERVAL